MVYIWLATASSIVGLIALLYAIYKLNNVHREPEEERRRCYRSISHVLYFSAFFIFLSVVLILVKIGTEDASDKKVKKKGKQRSYYNPGSVRRGDASRRVVVEQVVQPYQQPLIAPSAPAVVGGNSIRLPPGSSITINSS